MKTIYFQFDGYPQNFWNLSIGWLALAEYRILEDGTIILTHDAATIAELKAYGNDLKRMIDQAVKAAEQKLTS